MAEIESGGAEFQRMRADGRNHPVEVVGRHLREMMPFIETPTELDE